MNPASPLREHPSLRRLVHGVLLLGWLLSSQGVAPALCLAAALYDGVHGVKVGAASDGGTTVVLSHPTADAGDEHHDLLCDLLLVFAAAPERGGADHVLAFKSVDAISRVQRGALIDQQSKLVCHRLHPVPEHTFWQMRRAVVAVIKPGPAPAWSPGVAMKAGKMVMLC
jgi:hypothetical protein